MPLEPGQMLSHYRLVEKIGQGGMGVVWRAADEKLRRDVALKVLPPELAGNPERRRRLVHEARAAAAPDHPNIASIFEIGEADGQVFFAMELVRGSSLRVLLTGKSPPLAELLRVATEIAEGLASAHAAKLIHRDLKPENVMVRPDGRVKILDFGLAKVQQEQRDPGRSKLSQAETRIDELTRQGQVVGTAAYMSPEQARADALDARSDIFSFGSMLYEMVAGQAPFQGNSPPEILSAVMRDRPPVPSARRPDLPAELDRIVEKCLEKEPRERYQDAADLSVDLRRLRRAVESGPAEAAALSRGVTAPATRPKRWWKTMAMGAAGIILAVAVYEACPPAGRLHAHDRVIVADLENTTGRAELDGPLRDAIGRMLAESYFLRVRSREDLPDLPDGVRVGPEEAERSCAGGECDGYVLGTIEAASAGYRLAVALHEAGASRPAVRLSRTVESEDDLLGAVHEMLLELRGDLGEAPAIVSATCPPTTRSLAAYGAWIRGVSLESISEAVSVLESTVETDPAFVDGYADLSNLYQAREEWTKAVQFAEEAVRLGAGLPERCRMLLEIRLLEASHAFYPEIDRLRQYKAAFPWDPHSLHELGFIKRVWTWDAAAGEPDLRRSYALLSERGHEFTFRAVRNLARCLMDQGKADDIEALAAEFAAAGGSELTVLDAEARAHLVRGDWARVGSMMESHPSLRKWTTPVLLARGKLEEARRTARRPDYWLVLRDTGKLPAAAMEDLAAVGIEDLEPSATLCAEAGQPDPLAERLEALERERDEPGRWVREQLDFAWGCVALARGDAAEAVRIIEPIARGQNFVRRHRMLGRAYEAQESWSEAAIAYEAALRNPYLKWRLNPAAFVLDQFRLARVYERMDDADRALHWYQRFLDDWKDADPDIPEVLEARERLAVLKSEVAAS